MPRAIRGDGRELGGVVAGQGVLLGLGFQAIGVHQKEGAADGENLADEVAIQREREPAQSRGTVLQVGSKFCRRSGRPRSGTFWVVRAPPKGGAGSGTAFGDASHHRAATHGAKGCLGGLSRGCRGRWHFGSALWLGRLREQWRDGRRDGGGCAHYGESFEQGVAVDQLDALSAGERLSVRGETAGGDDDGALGAFGILEAEDLAHDGRSDRLRAPALALDHDGLIGSAQAEVDAAVGAAGEGLFDAIAFAPEHLGQEVFEVLPVELGQAVERLATLQVGPRAPGAEGGDGGEKREDEGERVDQRKVGADPEGYDPADEGESGRKWPREQDEKVGETIAAAGHGIG